jgi:hypothetical protein
MKTLTAPTLAEVANTATTPAYLVEMVYSSVLRLSSRGDQSWSGYAWTGGRLGKIAVAESGTIDIINSDLAYSALVLNEGAADIGCRVWKFYGDNPAAGDPTLVFDGVIDGADIGASAVRMSLSSRNRTYYSPRRFIGVATGFNHLSPAGTRVTWGGQTMSLERK